MTDKDIHDQLAEAYLEYFKASEVWEQQDSVRKYYVIRQKLKKLQVLVKKRQKEVRRVHLDNQAKKREIKKSKKGK